MKKAYLFSEPGTNELVASLLERLGRRKRRRFAGLNLNFLSSLRVSALPCRSVRKLERTKAKKSDALSSSDLLSQRKENASKRNQTITHECNTRKCMYINLSGQVVPGDLLCSIDWVSAQLEVRWMDEFAHIIRFVLFSFSLPILLSSTRRQYTGVCQVPSPFCGKNTWRTYYPISTCTT